ncbi:hypothetical protein K3495_g3203 [Podosphaera aphanis]|nr:hypothetical protein K3495_g3203 [Podosphaera aphanis]
MYNGGLVSLQAQRQKSTAQSALEDEITSANKGAKEIAHMEKIWKDISHQDYTPILYCDNDAAVQFAKDSEFHNKAKHIDLRYHIIRNDMMSKRRL